MCILTTIQTGSGETAVTGLADLVVSECRQADLPACMSLHSLDLYFNYLVTKLVIGIYFHKDCDP